MSAAGLVAWAAIAVAAVVGLSLIGLLYLGVLLAWEDGKTEGNAYYGLPLAERRKYRELLGRHARAVRPVVRISSLLSSVSMARATFRYEGIAGPKGSCSEETFERGRGYEPLDGDVFVVTQMKCGTTWMQHLVYQVLTRGCGGLAERGDALYAASPWLEGRRSVAVADAPLIGEERPCRIIKTHFPTTLCPLADNAKYVYVARHPVSCFASCADFVIGNLGAFAPDLNAIRDWYCSDEMWWSPWPGHVDGWWRLACRSENVLFVHFEDMKDDLAAVSDRVADFLGVRPLEDEERAAIVTKCGFAYMRDHAESFEMQPPHLLGMDAEFLTKGTVDRYRDVPEATRREVMAWCRGGLADGKYPVDARYPTS